jgi:Tfp pilus assembly protein PilF
MLVLSVALFFVAERYRIPLLIPLLVGSGAAIDQWMTFAAQRQWGRLVVRCVAVGIGIITLTWPLDMIDADGRREERVKMAEVSARAGDVEAASAWLRRALDIYPYPEVAHFRVAGILAEVGQTTAALAQLRSAAATPNDADDPDVWLQAGRLAMSLRAPEVGVGLFRRGVAQMPGDSAARDQYAIALMLSGDLVSARSEFLTVVDVDERNVDAWANLAYVEAQIGSPASALTYARRALAIQPSHELAGRIVEVIGGR